MSRLGCPLDARGQRALPLKAPEGVPSRHALGPPPPTRCHVVVQHRRSSRPELVLLIGAPLAWAVLLLFHPTGDGEDFYPAVGDEVTAWMTVHVATLVFVPLIAAVVYLLLRGVEGIAAQVSRAALAFFVLFYATWEALIGIGLGVLSDGVNGLPAAEQPAGAKVIEEFADSSSTGRASRNAATELMCAPTTRHVPPSRVHVPV
jgi:hypothetical protein